MTFSLTPALSRWERGSRSPLSGRTSTANRLKPDEFFGIHQRLFLLPAGEGQDEGERGDTKIRDHTISKYALIRLLPGI